MVAYGSLLAFFRVWLLLRQKKYLATIEYVLLAIDIPKDNEQSLLAVEQIFATLAGIRSGPNLWEKWWIGKVQLAFSLEIISLEGYIQFLIRVPAVYRDLTEAAVYAQYPEAEITEVSDYVDIIPSRTDENSDFKLWGTEFCLDKISAYPLKTYKLFEHSLSQAFIDPMASLMEVMSKLGPAEQLGLQIVLAPVGDDWKKNAVNTVKKLIGEEALSQKNIGDKAIDTALVGIDKFSEAVYSLWGDIKKKEDQKTGQNKYQQLTINQKFVVEMIENKLSKITFGATMRVYYLAHKDVYHRGRGVNAILGAINQFNATDLNSLKRYKGLTTDRDYFFVKQRLAHIQKKLVKYYKMRSRKGSPEFYLGTEELATLYHFPTISVKAPLLAKIESKKAEPPISLPLEQTPLSTFFKAKEKEVEPVLEAYEEEAPTDGRFEKITVPDYELESQDMQPKEKARPYVIKESLAGYDFDNDYFELQFGKAKKRVVPIKQETPALKKDNEDGPANLPYV